MTIIASKVRKTAAALVAAAVMASAFAPAAEARSGRTAAFIAGGVLLGALVAGSAAAYERDVVYTRDCWLEKRKRYDADGYPYFVKVRVCD